MPLELGGATNDPRNLWPEPGATPNPKDAVENKLRQEVCDSQLSLAQAQREIVTNWVRLGPALAVGAAGPAAPSSPAQGAECTLTASFSSHYNDYDVYVHSNQPDQSVTVIDAYGHSGTWHTDGSGYADVYFKSGGYASGRRITAEVGRAAARGLSEAADPRLADSRSRVRPERLRAVRAAAPLLGSPRGGSQVRRRGRRVPRVGRQAPARICAQHPPRLLRSGEHPASPSGLLHARAWLRWRGDPDGRANQGLLAGSEGLNEWAVGNLGYGLRSLRCQPCEPSSLGLTD